MLASKSRAQFPVVRQRSEVRLGKRAVSACHLPNLQVSKSRQALTGLAALISSMQSCAAQASPVSPELQAGYLVNFEFACSPFVGAICRRHMLSTTCITQTIGIAAESQLIGAAGDPSTRTEVPLPANFEQSVHLLMQTLRVTASCFNICAGSAGTCTCTGSNWNSCNGHHPRPERIGIDGVGLGGNCKCGILQRSSG